MSFVKNGLSLVEVEEIEPKVIRTSEIYGMQEIVENFNNSNMLCALVVDPDKHYSNNTYLRTSLYHYIKNHGFDNNIKVLMVNGRIYLKKINSKN